MTAIKRINKKAIFGISLLFSAVLGFFFATSKKYDSSLLSLVTEVPLGSIERVSAGDAGDCTGSSDSWDPSTTTSGVGITTSKYSGSNGGVTFGGGGCFIAGTHIEMADGSTKAIEAIVSGDMVKTSSGNEEVMKIFEIPFDGEIFAINDTPHFVTANHPFMTKDGWKSFDPEGTKKETPGLDVMLLQEGDILITSNGEIDIKTVNKKAYTSSVYNFTVNGSHDYYANSFLVHNVGTSFTKSQIKMAVMIK